MAAINVATDSAADGVADRDRRAASEAMTVVAYAPAMFEVYTAGDVYRVDLRDTRCTCDDHRYREPTDGCKHYRRVLMAIGARDIPRGVDVDHVLATHPTVHVEADRDA
jgi:hypothetical protein